MDERVDRPAVPIEPQPVSRETVPVRRLPYGKVILAVVVLAALGGGGWYWWTHRAAQPAARVGAGATAPQPVGVATIDTGDIHIILNELGTVTALANVTVKTQISGQFQEIGFKEGQQVKKGDFLAQIDPRPYQVALEQAQGTLAHDQGLLQQAQTNLRRYQTLGRQDSIAQQQVDDQRFLVTQYSGSIQSDQAQVDSAKLNLVYCHITAPVDGQVGLRQVDPGNYVQASDQAGIVVITQMDPISVIFSVPEDNLPEISTELLAGTQLQVQAFDRSNVNLLATGRLATLDNQIDTTTGTLKIRADFDNAKRVLYPNQFVNARLLVRTMTNTLRLPVAAIQRGEPGTFVYVVNADNSVSVRPVTLGPTDGGFSAVSAGLKAGERVVTDGTDRLRDGAAITIPPPQAPVSVDSTPAPGAAAAAGRTRRAPAP